MKIDVRAILKEKITEVGFADNETFGCLFVIEPGCVALKRRSNRDENCIRDCDLLNAIKALEKICELKGIK